MKKWVSLVGDGILGLAVVFLGYVLASMMISMNQPGSYGVPRVFGRSVLYVATDSMGVDKVIKAYTPAQWQAFEEQVSAYESDPENHGGVSPQDYNSAKHVLSQKAAIELTETFPIKHIDNAEGLTLAKVKPADVKVGDVVTFYDEKLEYANTHRVQEIFIYAGSTRHFQGAINPGEWNLSANEGDLYQNVRTNVIYRFSSGIWENSGLTDLSMDGHRFFRTRGDNLHSGFYQADWAPTYRDAPWAQDYLIGRAVSHSKALGTVLKFVSPAVPDGYATWFIPLMVGIPLSGIAVFTIVDSVKKNKAEKAKEEAEIAAALEKAGIDPNDEAAVLAFKEKQAYKIELRKEMEKAKEEEKERLRKEKEKEERRRAKEERRKGKED